MGFFNRIRADPGFVSPVRSDPGFVSPIQSDPTRSGPIRSDPGFVNGRSFCVQNINNYIDFRTIAKPDILTRT